MNRIREIAAIFIVMVAMHCSASADPSDPDLIFRKSTTFKLLTPNDKLAVYGIDDPLVDGVACHYTSPEKGGLSGALGLAEQTSDISLSCRQYGQSSLKECLPKAMLSSVSAGRSYLKKCKSFGDAIRDVIFSFT